MNVFPSIGSLSMHQDFADSRGEFRDARIAHVAILGGADELANVTHIGGHDGQVAGHRLFDDVWRAFLKGRKNQSVTRTHVECQALPRLFGNYQQFEVQILSREAIGYGCGQRKTFDSNFRVGGKKQILLERVQSQLRSGLLSLCRLKDLEIDFMRDNVNTRPVKLSSHFVTLNDGRIDAPRKHATHAGEQGAQALPLASAVNPSEYVAPVIGNHDRYFPLRTRHHAHKAVVCMNEINRAVGKALPQVKNCFWINEFPVAIFEDQQVDIDTCSLE